MPRTSRAQLGDASNRGDRNQVRPPDRELLAGQLGRMHYLRALGRFDEARSVADRMDAAIRAAQEFSGFEDVLPSMLIPMGTTRVLTGQIDDAISTFMAAVRWSSSGWPHPAERHARNYLALGYALRGHIRRARAEAASDDTTRSMIPGGLGHVFENGTQYLPALVALAELDRPAATAAIARLSTTEHHVFWWLDSAVRARFALFWGDCEPAARSLELDLLAHQSLCGPGSFARGVLNGTLADLRFASGDTAGAWSALDEAGSAPAGPWLEATRHRLSGALRRARPDSSMRAAHHVINAVATDRIDAPLERDRHIELARRAIELDGDVSAIAEASTNVGVRLSASLGIPLSTIRLLGNRWQLESLTAREIEVIRALRHHSTVRALAAELFLSTNTVKTHLRNIYRKLGVSTRAAALAAARSVGTAQESQGDDHGRPDPARTVSSG